MKPFFIRLHWLLSSQFGIDPAQFIQGLRGLPSFLKDWHRYRQNYTGEVVWKPCLHDRYKEGGTAKSEYFLQDLVVARWVSEAQPRKHVDVGSRVDGFVAHVASFREIEVFDVRPITANVPGIVFRQADLMQGDQTAGSAGAYCDSLSCLHALEHFGLGRYGDPIDPKGHEIGFANMARLLEPGGTFYISTPVGRERIEFNANRVFDPRTIIGLARSNNLVVRKLAIISRDGSINEIEARADALLRLADSDYHLAIFAFVKGPQPHLADT